MLFSAVKSEGAKLLLYQAPTGMENAITDRVKQT